MAAALTSKHPGGLFSSISIVFAVVTILVGIGLIARVELARGIVNVLCFLQILDGAFGLLGGFIFSFAIPLIGALAMGMSLLKIALALAMVFVIGETESRAANI